MKAAAKPKVKAKKKKSTTKSKPKVKKVSSGNKKLDIGLKTLFKLGNPK
jgi:hypothetical protein